MTTLGDRLLAIHDALDDAQLPHAIGGAIALAYCTREPRGTRDIDINVFVSPDRADEVLDAMPEGVRVSSADRARVRRDGQVRLWWEDTPVDLFLDTHAFHRFAAASVHKVPFEGRTISVLGCTSLVVFKALFGRTQDWADIESLLHSGPGPGREALILLTELVGEDDAAVRRLADLVGA